jgi:hypothetical protein
MEISISSKVPSQFDSQEMTSIEAEVSSLFLLKNEKEDKLRNKSPPKVHP